MREDYVLVDLTADLLPLKAVKAKSEGARLVQICAVNTETGYDLLYSFANKYHFVNYKVPLKHSPLPFCFKFHSQEKIEMITKCFCAGVKSKQASFLLDIADIEDLYIPIYPAFFYLLFHQHI